MKNDEKRIDRICSLINKIWKKKPELRLTQILGDCFDDELALPFVEDNDLETQLKSIYGEE
jgi:uncharacterized protein YihD (DUF1040 family)